MAKKRANGEGTINRRPDGTWQGQVSLGYTLEGKRSRPTVYGKTQKEVREKLDALKRQSLHGSAPDAKLTVGVFLQQWLAEKSPQLKVRTADDYRYNLEKYVIPKIGSLKLSKLTPLKIQAMLRSIAEAVSADRANKCRRVLNGALKQAVRWQLIPLNPVEATDPMKHTRTEMHLWSAAEVTRFLSVAYSHRLYALFYLAMSTGLRCGKLLGLEWGDLKGTTLHVNRSLVKVGSKLVISTPKTKKGHRRVELSPDVLVVLEEHRRKQDGERRFLGEAWPDSGLMFPSTVGTYIQPCNLSRTWHKLQEKAGVFRVRLHDLRHLHASVAIKEGMDPKVLADRLGHARASFTLDVYTHLFEEQRASSAVSIASLILQAPSAPN